MGTVSKALKLLDLFSNERSAIGLTEFVKLSGYDKATTHRRLTELASSGFLEQDIKTRTYRLGAAIIRLANVREHAFPMRDAAMPALQRLSETTKETVHLSLIQGRDGLGTLVHLESIAHAMRVYLDPSEILPFHATSSGIVSLAFADNALLEHVLESKLAQFTENTLTKPGDLMALIDRARASGFGIQSSGFEDQVHGVAAPVFDHYSHCIGAVAVATPTTRLTVEHEELCTTALKTAAVNITESWGGHVPNTLKKVWSLTPQ